MFAIIRKSDDYVLVVESVSRNPNGSESWYEKETSHKFAPPVHSHWWSYNSTSQVFTNTGVHRKENESAKVDLHTTQYASHMTAQGFTGNPRKIADIETWIDSQVDGAVDLAALKVVLKAMFKSTARAVAALAYGWREDPDG